MSITGNKSLSNNNITGINTFGSIQGDIDNLQEQIDDLQDAVDINTADIDTLENNVVYKTGNQSIAGNKTFSGSSSFGNTTFTGRIISTNQNAWDGRNTFINVLNSYAGSGTNLIMTSNPSIIDINYKLTDITYDGINTTTIDNNLIVNFDITTAGVNLNTWMSSVNTSISGAVLTTTNQTIGGDKTFTGTIEGRNFINVGNSGGNYGSLYMSGTQLNYRQNVPLGLHIFTASNGAGAIFNCLKMEFNLVTSFLNFVCPNAIINSIDFNTWYSSTNSNISNCVTLSTTQTITGAKTFTATILQNANGLTNNTYIGISALSNNVSGVRNIAIGANTLTNSISNDCTAIGSNALNIQSSVNAFSNSAFGSDAGRYNLGQNNTYLGRLTGQISTDTNTYNKSTAIGWNAITDASNQITIGTSTETTRFMGNTKSMGFNYGPNSSVLNYVTSSNLPIGGFYHQSVTVSAVKNSTASYVSLDILEKGVYIINIVLRWNQNSGNFGTDVTNFLRMSVSATGGQVYPDNTTIARVPIHHTNSAPPCLNGTLTFLASAGTSRIIPSYYCKNNGTIGSDDVEWLITYTKIA